MDAEGCAHTIWCERSVSTRPDRLQSQEEVAQLRSVLTATQRQGQGNERTQHLWPSSKVAQTAARKVVEAEAGVIP